MKITLKNHIDITGAPESLRREIEARLSFPNPQWEANDKMNRWNGSTPRVLRFSRENGKWQRE